MASRSVPLFLADVPPANARGRVLHEDLGISIDREGVWYYGGSPITRKELVCLFAQALCRDEDGDYWLVTPSEMGRIQVEDVPFLAVELYSAGSGRDQRLSFRTNVDEIVPLDGDHPLRLRADAATGVAIPYLGLGRRMEARLTRAVYYDLVARAEETRKAGASVLGVWSGGVWHLLGTLEAQT